jgi:hypothetical protein
MKAATRTATFKATFQESIAGAVLQKVTRGSRRVDLRSVPQEVVDYLLLTRANDAAPWKFDGDGFDALAACEGVKVRARKDAPRQATVEFSVDLASPTMPAETLPRTWHDGSHWGISDWYEPLEAAIKAALARGKSYAWTTGWYASKKEIMSACISQRGGEITVEVSVSDDFDTEGLGERTIRFTKNIDRIREALDAAAKDAEGDRHENQCYHGFSVGRNGAWEFTLILPEGDGYLMDSPPGDNYHRWGWQEVEDGEERPAEISADDATNLLAAAHCFIDGEVSSRKQWAVVCGEWTIRAWDDEDDA